MIIRKNAEGVGDRRESQGEANAPEIVFADSHIIFVLYRSNVTGIWRCGKGFVSLCRHSAFAHRDKQTTDEGNDNIKALESERHRANIIQQRQT